MHAVCLTLLLLASEAPEELARQAEEEFAEGLSLLEQRRLAHAHFRKAAACYEAMRRQGIDNALLERNLGNAYFLADDLPRAILAFRRGLRLSPGDRQLRGNLEEARAQVIYSEGSSLGQPPIDHFPPWLPVLTSGQLFLLAALLYASGCLMLARWWMLHRRLWLWLGGVLLVVGLLGTMLISWREKSRDDRPIVVIAHDGVLLRKGNGLAFPPWEGTPLNRGVEARLVHRLDGWVQIELSGGEIGWVAEEQIVAEVEHGT